MRLIIVIRLSKSCINKYINCIYNVYIYTCIYKLKYKVLFSYKIEIMCNDGFFF